MITLKVLLKGIPFYLIIDGKKVVYERRTIEGEVIETCQWYPPVDKRTFGMIDPFEYAQWHSCRTEDEVYRLIKLDLMKNGCVINNEERK